MAARQGDRAPTPAGKGCTPCTRFCAVMTAPLHGITEPAPASEAPEVIHLPDLRQPSKKVTSGSNKRRRQHLERFRTDDAEHAALHEQLRATGLSLGAYVMKLAAIEGGECLAHPAARPCAGRCCGADAGAGCVQSRRE
jgi:hypothetical protein